MVGCLDRSCKARVLDLAGGLLRERVEDCVSGGGSEGDCLEECVDAAEMALGMDTRAPAIYEC